MRLAPAKRGVMLNSAGISSGTRQIEGTGEGREHDMLADSVCLGTPCMGCRLQACFRCTAGIGNCRACKARCSKSTRCVTIEAG